MIVTKRKAYREKRAALPEKQEDTGRETEGGRMRAVSELTRHGRREGYHRTPALPTRPGA